MRVGPYTDPKIVPTKFRNRVSLVIKGHAPAAILPWCHKYFGYYFYDHTFFTNLNGERSSMYSFAKPEDAVAFKLKWT